MHTSAMTRELTIAFAGNPNVGKTALINSLAHSRLKVGNWPGVTVEKKEASMTLEGHLLHLIDLPGTYSLSPYTIEERVCRDYLLQDPPDLVVNVIDASNLEKSLYLTLQLLEMGLPMIIALNMWDEFEGRGYRLDLKRLSQRLELPVITSVGKYEAGVEDLRTQIMKSLEHAGKPWQLAYPEAIEREVGLICDEIREQPFATGAPLRWLAVKLLEQEQHTLEQLQERFDLDLSDYAQPHRERLQSFYPNLEEALSRHRRDFVAELATEVLQPPLREPQDKTDLVDRLLLNEWTGIPVFLAVLFVVFKLTFDISTPFVDWVDGFFNGFLASWLGFGLESLHVPALIISLVKDGLIGGVGLVLSFVPILIFLYLFLALLEESGYMARAAFLMDRFMFRFGLHGKSFVPLLVGFGCNVPGVFATRALESETDRKITVAVMSFMSCGAKLPIYAMFTAVFFERYQALVILLMYLTGILVAITWAIILRKTRFKAEIPVFVMELPPYRIPTFKMLWASIWLKTWAFVRQAGTVIAISMLLLWSLVNLPYGAPPEQTVLGYSAKAVAPIFLPQGFGQRWEPVASILPGFMAKEMVVGAMGVVLSVQTADSGRGEQGFWQDLGSQITGLGQAVITASQAVVANILPTPFVLDQQKESPLTVAVRRTFTPLSAFSYMVFNLLLLSCISVVGAMVQEFGGRYLGFVFLITTSTAYVFSALVYQLGHLMGLQ